MTQTDPASLEQDKILAPLLQRADVQALLRRGNEQKQLTYQTFLAALPDDDFDERQVDAVYRHLIEAGVTIVNQEELDAELLSAVRGGAEVYLLTDGDKLYLEDSRESIVDILVRADQPMVGVCVSDQLRRLASLRQPSR